MSAHSRFVTAYVFGNWQEIGRKWAQSKLSEPGFVKILRINKDGNVMLLDDLIL
jgi:hypothetical protein